MLKVCPKCEKRYEVNKSDEKLDFPCLCGEIIKPINITSQTSKEQDQDYDQQKIKCPKCGQIYEKSAYRKDTKIRCKCGNVLTLFQDTRNNPVYGRRKTDQNSYVNDLQNLIKTSQLIHLTISDIDNLLMTVTNITTEMLDVEGSSIILKEADELVFYAVSGDKASKLNNFRLPIGEGIVGKCISTLSSIIVNDTKNDEQFSSKVDESINFTTRSILCVPLIVEGLCIGALEMVNKKHNKEFMRHDLLLADAVACQIAIAINNCQLQKEALKRERLAAIGESVTGIAHCVKNMLNGLQGGLYILKKELEDAGLNFNSSGLEMFSQSTKRLSDLVQDMLTYSKDRKPEFETTNINNLVKSIVDLMQTKALEKNLTLLLQIDRDIGNIYIDGKGIYRAILNIVSNAIDACSGIKNATINIVTSLNEKEVVISITDQGCGMDEKTLSSIFQPFYSTKGSKGTGLGLSVTQKIIKENGGSIEINSVVGHGSQFKVYLPITSAPA